MGNSGEIKVPVAFNVGIAGHRDINVNEEKLITKTITDILKGVKENVYKLSKQLQNLNQENSVHLRMISMLAEGSDRIAAKCALELGYELQCPLPFTKEDFISDFKEQHSKNEFLTLISKADRVFELDFGRENEPQSYLDAGLVMLEHSDFIIAVWDGNKAKGRGGTEEIVNYALYHEIPVIWIDRKNLDKISYLKGSKNYKNWKNKLEEFIKEMLLPENILSDSDNRIIHSYFEKKIPKSRFSKLYTRFVKTLSWKYKRKKKAKFKTNEKASNKINNYSAFINSNYDINYKRADQLALYYSDVYRTASFLRALFPLLASVGLAFGFYWKWGTVDIISLFGFFIQALFIYLVIFLSGRNDKYEWHKKFVDYRIIAELMRQMLYLAPLGYVTKQIRSTESMDSWFKWHCRAVIRYAALPTRILNRSNLQDYYQYVKKEYVLDQIEYNASKYEIMSRIASRLKKVGIFFFTLGIIVTAARFFVYTGVQIHLFPKEMYGIKITTFFNMLSMVLPAIGGGMFGILAQCGFENLAQKHKGMITRLQNLNKEMEDLQSEGYDGTVNIVLQAAELMAYDVNDWRILLKSKGIKKY